MQPDVYIIAAMPRSRTAWLANLLTHRSSHCLHDPGIDCESIEDLLAMVREAGSPDRIGASFVGIADTGVAHYWEALFDALPQARVVLVERDLGEIKASWRRYTRDHPELNGDRSDAIFDDIHRKFAALRRAVRLREALVVQFRDMRQVDVCGEIWEFCCPGVKFNEARCAWLQTVNVQVSVASYVTKINLMKGVV